MVARSGASDLDIARVMCRDADTDSRPEGNQRRHHVQRGRPHADERPRDGLTVQVRALPGAQLVMETANCSQRFESSHVRGGLRRVLFIRLGEAVAPSGTLLVIGHDLSDLSTSVPRHGLAEAGCTVEDVSAALDDE